MKTVITPCLWYNNQAQEAAALYCSVFKGATINKYQSPIVTEIHVSGQGFILLDGGPMYKPNPSISFYYICETEQELETIWDTFITDGSVLMPLDTYPWSKKYGFVTDKFGVSWQLALGNVSEVGQKITSSLLFTNEAYGRAEEAIEHYASVFKNVQVDGILRYAANEQPEQEGKVKHAQMSLGGYKLMLMESTMEHNFSFSEGVSLTIYCETQEEIDYYWNKLTQDGEESRCGWLKDKFGISWQVVPTILAKIMSDPAKAPKAAQAFMSMRKLDIEQIVQASLS